jgi:hypothetical protein
MASTKSSKAAASKQRSVRSTDSDDDSSQEIIVIRKADTSGHSAEGKESKLSGPHLTSVGVRTRKGRMPKTKGGLYVLKFRYAASLDTGGSGTGFAAAPWDVSAAADFSSAAALFAECKVVATQIEAATQLPTSGANARCLMGADYSVTNSAPASEAAVLQLEDIKLFSISTAVPICEHRKVTEMAWAACSSPVPGPYAGLYGQWSLSAAGSNSIGAFNYLVTVWVAFRGRK